VVLQSSATKTSITLGDIPYKLSHIVQDSIIHFGSTVKPIIHHFCVYWLYEREQELNIRELPNGYTHSKLGTWPLIPLMHLNLMLQGLNADTYKHFSGSLPNIINDTYCDCRNSGKYFHCGNIKLTCISKQQYEMPSVLDEETLVLCIF